MLDAAALQLHLHLLIMPTRPRKRNWEEFARGGGAAFVNIVTTFPVNKLMFRQQLTGASTRAAFRGMYHEGMGKLYRGVGPPLVQKTLSMALMFGLYDRYYCLLRGTSSTADLPEVAVVGLAGIAAGSTEAMVTPLERVQTLLQTPRYNRAYTGTLDALVKLRPYGMREYYRGASAILMRNGPANVLYFGLRRQVKECLPRSTSQAHDALNDFISGALLGASISTLFYPVNVVKAHMQSDVGGRYAGVWETLREVYAQRGSLAGIYRGVHINFTRSLVSWGIINSVYELMHKSF